MVNPTQSYLGSQKSSRLRLRKQRYEQRDEGPQPVTKKPRQELRLMM